jgi:hypothetical protein
MLKRKSSLTDEEVREVAKIAARLDPKVVRAVYERLQEATS